MPTPWTDITEADDWAETPFIAAIFAAWNERRVAIGHRPCLVPVDNCDVSSATITPPLTESTIVTRSGTTATATYNAGPQAKVGDLVTVSGCDQPEYNGTHTVTGVLTSPWRLTFEVTGSPVTPATGTSTRIWNQQRMPFSLAAIQDWLQKACIQFSDRSRTAGGVYPSNDPVEFRFTMARWRASAVLHADGFRRKKPREITSTSVTTDTNSNARATGQRAWLTGGGTNGGKLHEFDGAAWVCSDTSKSVTTLTRSGTTATATVTAHAYPDGSTVVVAGSAVAGYNGRKVITVVDANKFTYTVPNTLTTPAAGTKTAKRQILESVNVLDSATAAPNRVPYGVHQPGDYITSTMCNEIRAGMRQLLEASKTARWFSGLQRWQDPGFMGTYDTNTPRTTSGTAGAWSRVNLVNDVYLERDYNVIHQLSGMPTVPKAIDIYALGYLPQEPGAGVFETHGDSIVLNAATLFETKNTSGDTIDISPWGQETAPATFASDNITYGYDALFLCVIRFDIAGGFQYV